MFHDSSCFFPNNLWALKSKILLFIKFIANTPGFYRKFLEQMFVKPFYNFLTRVGVWSMRRDKIQTRFITRCIVITFCSVSVLTNVFAATFTVTKTSDTFPNGKPGELRWAIQQSNKTAGAHVINFNIPGTGPFEIKPVEPLDLIRKKVTIDGYSQPCAFANTLAQGSNAHLLIVLNGSNYTVGSGFANFANGLTFVPGSEGSVVKGLVFNEWLTDGIF